MKIDPSFSAALYRAAKYRSTLTGGTPRSSDLIESGGRQEAIVSDRALPTQGPPSSAPERELRAPRWVMRSIEFQGRDPQALVQKILDVRNEARLSGASLRAVQVKLSWQPYEGRDARSSFEQAVSQEWTKRTGTPAAGIRLDFGHAEQPYWPD